MFTACLLLVVIVGHGVLCQGKASTGQNPKPEPPSNLYAVCEVKPSTNLPQGQPEVYGQVLFKQYYPDGSLQIMLNLQGFPIHAAAHAIHIHHYGNTGEGCRAAGPHFNPEGLNHPYHLGDLGNFGPSHGQIRMLLKAKADLYGVHSVLGRSIVIHEKVDDMGLGGDEMSLKSGNAGQRIACCVIEVSNAILWNMTVEPILEESTEE